MHYLSVLAVYGCEAHLCAVRVCHSIHLSAYKLLSHSRTGESHGCGVHHVAYLCGSLQLLYFLRFLCRTHLYHSLYEFHARSFLLLYRMDAEQIENLYLYVVAVRRQEVNLAFLLQGLVAGTLQRAHRCSVLHAHLCREVMHAVHAAIPYDVFDVDVVAEDCLTVVVDVDHSDESVSVLSEIIQERRVLSERIIAIARIVAWRLVVSEKYDYSVLYKTF